MLINTPLNIKNLQKTKLYKDLVNLLEKDKIVTFSIYSI